MSARVAAGAFGEWLAAMRRVLRGEQDADVPCGGCVGCCVSSYPIPLRTEDELARAQVPEQWLLGPARAGERWLMGFREDGSCPFLKGNSCSIYAGRPQTCRDYDCRIYSAAGLVPDGVRPVIAERVAKWEFVFSSEQERDDADAVRRAAQFIRTNHALFPPVLRAGSATAAAVLAVKTYPLFLGAMSAAPEHMVSRVVEAAHAFDGAGS